MPVPIFKEVHSRLPFFIRRRIRQAHSRRLVLVLMLLAITIVAAQIGLLFVLLRPEQDGLRPLDGQVKRVRGKPVASRIIGVEGSKLPLYVPDADHHFACLSTGQKISFDKVNDDFCDCPDDGSDEPSTGACPNSRFFCTTTGKVESIPSSRINDMICDCCDGSDEWILQPSPNPEFDLLPKELQLKLGKFQAPCETRC